MLPTFRRFILENFRLRKSCGRPGQLSPRVNIMHYVTSPHSAKPRRWPPDTCGMAFEKLILPAPDKLRGTWAGISTSQHSALCDVASQLMTSKMGVAYLQIGASYGSR